MPPNRRAYYAREPLGKPVLDEDEKPLKILGLSGQNDETGLAQ